NSGDFPPEKQRPKPQIGQSRVVQGRMARVQCSNSYFRHAKIPVTPARCETTAAVATVTTGVPKAHRWNLAIDKNRGVQMRALSILVSTAALISASAVAPAQTTYFVDLTGAPLTNGPGGFATATPETIVGAITLAAGSFGPLTADEVLGYTFSS